SGAFTACDVGFVNHVPAAIAEQTRDLLGAELCADKQDHDFAYTIIEHGRLVDVNRDLGSRNSGVYRTIKLNAIAVMLRSRTHASKRRPGVPMLPSFASCEACNPEHAEIPFTTILDRLTDHSNG